MKIVQQRVDIISLFFQNNDSVEIVPVVVCRNIYVSKLLKKIQKTKSVANKKGSCFVLPLIEIYPD